MVVYWLLSKGPPGCDTWSINGALQLRQEVLTPHRHSQEDGGSLPVNCCGHLIVLHHVPDRTEAILLPRWCLAQHFLHGAVAPGWFTASSHPSLLESPKSSSQRASNIEQPTCLLFCSRSPFHKLKNQFWSSGFGRHTLYSTYNPRKQSSSNENKSKVSEIDPLVK